MGVGHLAHQPDGAHIDLEQPRRRRQRDTEGTGNVFHLGDLGPRRAHIDPAALGAQREEPGAALLLELAIARLGNAGADRSVGAADGGMPGEGQLVARRENAQAIVARFARREERGLREIGPARNALHVGALQSFAVEHDRDRVAEERPAGKDVDLLEAAHALSYFRMRSRLWCESVKVGRPGRSSISSETSSMCGHARSFVLRVTITWSVDVYQ